MKLKTILFVTISLIFFLISCSEGDTKDKQKAEVVEEIKKPTFSALYVNYRTTEGSGRNLTINDSLATLSPIPEYLDITLSFRTDGLYHAATSSLIFIADEEGNNILFANSNEYLNFMAEHGYEFVDQIKRNYTTDYLFKRIITKYMNYSAISHDRSGL